MRSNCIDVGAHAGAVLSAMLRLAPQRSAHGLGATSPSGGRSADTVPDGRRPQCGSVRSGGEEEFVFVTTNPGQSGLRQRTHDQPEEIERIRVKVESPDDSLPAGYVP